jgi:hypothetical protein
LRVRSRRISSDHFPPITSSARATGHLCPYPLAVTAAPVLAARTLFALAAQSMGAYGVATAAAVHFTPWQGRR